MQEELRVAAMQLAESDSPLSRVRELIDHHLPTDRGYLRKAAALGWFSLLTEGPGRRLGVADAAVVAECRGTALQPGPVIPMTVVAMCLQGSAGASHRHVGEQVARGAATASWLWADANGHWASKAPINAAPDGPGWVLDGTSGMAQDADSVDWLMIRATTPTGERSCLVPAGQLGISRVPLASFDLTRSWVSVTFDQVRVGAAAMIEGRGGTRERLLAVAATLTMAEAVGAMDRLFENTVLYAKDRVAFGRPIGSFQAIKHLLADASVMLETSKAMAGAAIEAVDHDVPDVDQIVSMAKAFVGDASREVVEACWQTHGGIAYRWDHDFHLYLRRLTTDAGLYGDPTWHRRRLCRLQGLSGGRVGG